MSVVQLDIQKIEQLLNSATTSRQRKMYQALLDKARSQKRSSTDSSAPGTTPETEKKTQTKTKGQTETKTKAKTANKKKKATLTSTTTEASPAIPQSKTTDPGATTQLTPDSSDTPPQTQPSSLSIAPQKQQPDAETRIFQALGTVIATPYVKDDRLKVAIDKRSYDLLYVRGGQRRFHRSLRAELEKNGSKEMFLKLYPQVKYDYKSQQPRLSFSLVNFSFNCEELNNYPKGFVLRGIWQYIPHDKSPVITIYRNGEQKAYFKKLNKSQQLSFAQPLHIPVVWDGTVEPFKYNPQAETGEQMPRYFVEVRAIFKDGLFVVEEMLREPTLKIPKFIKVSKKKQPSIS